MTVLGLLAFGCSPAVERGHVAFAEGRLEDAVSAWSAAADGRSVSGVLAYDLGTAYYRKGDLPRAIVWLRTAARLRPRDGNVHHNLELARVDLGPGVPEPASLPYRWMAIVTPGELGLVGSLIAAVGSFLVVAAGLVPSRFSGARGVGAGALLVGLLAGSAGAVGAGAAARHAVAVVVDREAPLRDAAAIDAGERFTVPMGTELRIEGSEGAFLLVEDGRGRRGWVAADAVRIGWGPRAGSPG